MDQKAKQALETAYNYVQDMGQIADSSKDEQVLLMHNVAQVIHHVGWAIVRQLAASSDIGEAGP